jgi:hypothetical protein
VVAASQCFGDCGAISELGQLGCGGESQSRMLVGIGIREVAHGIS